MPSWTKFEIILCSLNNRLLDVDLALWSGNNITCISLWQPGFHATFVAVKNHHYVSPHWYMLSNLIRFFGNVTKNSVQSRKQDDLFPGWIWTRLGLRRLLCRIQSDARYSRWQDMAGNLITYLIMMVRCVFVYLWVSQILSDIVQNI